MSLIISLYMDCDTSGVQLLGNMGSGPLSMISLSSSHLLKDSGGASIPGKRGKFWKFQQHSNFASILVFLFVSKSRGTSTH